MDIAQPCKNFLVQFPYSTDIHLILSSFIVSSLFIVLLSVGMNQVLSYLLSCACFLFTSLNDINFSPLYVSLISAPPLPLII